MSQDNLDKKEDLRIIRTKKLLAEALYKLLEEKDYASISVLELCDIAMVHRATFYKHFEDKDDFLRYFIFDIVSKFSPKEDSDSKYFTEYYVKSLEEVLDFLEENRKMIRLVFEKTPNLFVLDVLYDALLKTVTHKIENNIQRGIVYKIPKEVIASFYTGAFINLAKWWVLSDNTYSKKDMNSYFKMLALGSMQSTIEGISESVG